MIAIAQSQRISQSLLGPLKMINLASSRVNVTLFHLKTAQHFVFYSSQYILLLFFLLFLLPRDANQNTADDGSDSFSEDEAPYDEFDITR